MRSECGVRKSGNALAPAQSSGLPKHKTLYDWKPANEMLQNGLLVRARGRAFKVHDRLFKHSALAIHFFARRPPAALAFVSAPNTAPVRRCVYGCWSKQGGLVDHRTLTMFSNYEGCQDFQEGQSLMVW